MRRSMLATILIILVFALVVGMHGNALADTYTYTGLGGGLAPLSLASNGSSVFAGMESGHVWRNTGGTGWVDAGRLDGGTVNSLVWDGTSIYAGTSNGQVYYYISDGTWGWAGYGAGYGNSVTCLVATGVAGNIYAGSSNRHVYWKNGSSSWLDTATDMGSNVLQLTRSSSYVYASTANGLVFRYNNNPSSPAWTNLGYCGTSSAHVVWNDSYGLYALGYNCHAWNYTGSSWSDTGLVGFFPVTTFTGVGSTLYAGNDHGQVWSYGGSWGNTSLPYSGTTAVQALATSGADLFAASWNGHVGRYSASTWTDVWPTGRAQVNALLSSGDVYAGCDNGQVYDYEGGWAAAGNNIGSPVLSLASTTLHMYAGCDNGNVYWNNSGTWTSTSGPGRAYSLATDGSILYAGCEDGHIWYYDTIFGGSWQDGADLASGAVNSLAWTGTTMYAATQNGAVFRYDAPGNFHTTGLSTGGAATLTLCFNEPSLYAGTADGHVYSYDGSNWSDIFPSGFFAVHSLAGNGDTVFAGVGNGQVLRYMGGSTWNTSGSVGSSPVEALTWTGTYMWTGSDVGSYRGVLTVPPTVTTDAATSITSTGATLNGNMTDTGGENADNRGFRYRKTGAGSWTDWTLAGSFGTGAFSHELTGLDPATDYEYQAYAHNPVGGEYGSTVTFKSAPSPKPVVDSVSPSSGAPGTRVTISGDNFGAGQGSSTVTVGGVEANVVSWSDTKIVIIIPGGTQGGAVVVTTAQGGSNTDKVFTVTSSTWYLAEGTTAWGFSTHITIENPNNTRVRAKFTYMDPNAPASGKGIIRTRTIAVPPQSQTTVDPRVDIGDVDFSTKVDCLEGKSIAVDRTMTWTGEGAASEEGHSSIGVTAPSTTWYMPEGSCDWNFETWTLIQNPNPKQASVTLTYMVEGKGPVTFKKTVPAYSRASYNMTADLNERADASVEVNSNLPVIAERSMYRNNRREGSCSVGAPAPATDYFLAEGATGYDVGFTTYVLVQNPNDSDVQVTLTYQTPSGAKPQVPFTMPANSRKTIRVNDVAGMGNTDFSTAVHGSKPIIAERAMYWDNGTGEACHDSIGMNSPHTTFYLPDGETGGSSAMETWTLVQNPNGTDVKIQVSYLTPSGKNNVSFTDTVKANSRKTYNMGDKMPAGRAAVLVTSKTAGKKIMVERAMYWNNRGAGTDTVGGFSD